MIEIKTLTTFEELQAEAHRNALEKGWWDKPVSFGDAVANFVGKKEK